LVQTSIFAAQKTKTIFMKKILLSFLAFVLLASSVEAAVALPLSDDPVNPSTITAEGFKKMTPKEFQQITGKKLSVPQKIAFKAVQKKMAKPAGTEGKSQVVALILVLLVGALGIHRFYLGYTWQGVVQLLTLGGLGVWALIDLIRIITGDLKPKDGEYGTTL